MRVYPASELPLQTSPQMLLRRAAGWLRAPPSQHSPFAAGQ